MNPTIQKMQQDLERFRASKQGGGSLPATSTPASPVVPQTPSTNTSPIARDLEQYRASRASGTLPQAQKPPEGNFLADMAKSIFGAPATILARPLQLGAELAMPGDNTKEIDEFSSKYSGGLVAPIPQNFGDVKKDVGRGLQTVALGTGAPIAGGALFGAGHALEQGNDLLSVETAFNVATGGAAGKVLSIVGKPLLNAAGKVVGTITPQTLKDVAKTGSEGIQRFMRENQLLGGAAAPVSERIATGLQKVDEGIEGAFSRGGSGMRNAVVREYPGLDLKKHYSDVNERDFIKPTTENKPAFSKATNIYNDAKNRGIDLEKTFTRRRIQHDDLIGDGKYNTKDVAEQIRQSNFTDANEVLRPALKEIEPGIQLLPISRVRQGIIDEIKSQSATKLTPKEKEAMIRQIEKDYADVSPNARANPRGYSITGLHDGRIVSMGNGKYVPGVSTPPAVLKAKLARLEGSAFKKLFDKTLPEGTGIEGVRREFEENFLLADYLDALNSKTVPEGIAKKATRLFGRAAAATVGGKIGGFPGAILGSQYGDMLFSSFAVLPNPLKRAVLNRLKAEKSPAFEVLDKFMKASKAEREAMLALPAAGQSAYKEESPRLFTTPGGRSTRNMQEAVDVTAVEQGNARTPKTPKRTINRKTREIQEAPEAYLRPEEMDIIKVGRKPKRPRSLSDIFIDE